MQLWEISVWVVTCVIAITIILVIGNRRNFDRSIHYAIGGVFLSIGTLAFPYYVTAEHLIPGIFESFLVAVQAFLLHGTFLPAVQSAEHILGNAYFIVYSITMGLLYLIAPLLTATFIFEYLSTYLSSNKIKHSKNNDIYLFSELNQKTITLAKSIKAMEQTSDDKRKISIVFTGVVPTSDLEMLRVQQMAKDEAFCCLKQQMPFLVVKRTHNRRLFLMQMSENEDHNLESAIEAIEKYKDLKEYDVQIYILTSKPEAELILDSIEKGNIQTQILNESQTCIYQLYDELPLYSAEIEKTGKISVLIIGKDTISWEALRAATWCGQLDGTALEINVIDKDADSWKSQFQSECPELMNGNYAISFHKAETLSTEFYAILESQCKDSNYIIVAQGDDDLNIKVAIALRRHYIQADIGYVNWPLISLIVRNEEKYKAVTKLKIHNNNKGYGLNPFGNIQNIYSYDVMINSPLHRLAINVHAVYESNYKSESEITYDSIIPGFLKYELFRRSNMANALHIKYKLWSVGLKYIPSEDLTLDEEFNLDNATRDKLVRLEHARWVAFQRTEGWQSASIDQAKKYMKTGLNDKHKHPIAKLHPCICDYSKLQLMCDEFDPKFIEYDLNFILKIPEILHDKWGITGDSYRIVKLHE